MFLGEMGMNNPSRKGMPPRFVVPPLVPVGKKWNVVQYKKFPQNLIRTQKRKM